MTQPGAAEGIAIGEPDDVLLVNRLRAGDDDAFVRIVEEWSPMMLRVARSYVSTPASAQEIVQEAWLAVVRGLEGFEGRSSLRTWAFRILTNLAKTRGVREARTVPMSALAGEADGDDGPIIDPDRFRGADDQWSGHWKADRAPQAWQPSPEQSALADEIRRLLAAALELLPTRQRVVVSLRDVHGLSSEEVCDALEISAANQRVLLHRARGRLRLELEEYYRGSGALVGS